MPTRTGVILADSLPSRLHALSALLLGLLFVLSGCGDEDGTSIDDQMRRGDPQGYIAGDGSIQVLAPAERQTTITLEGVTLEGHPWSSADHSGEVVVINVWGSWCPPCVAETPDLEQVASTLDDVDAPVQFIGVNYRDSVPSAFAFQRKFAVTYPSLQDDGGRTRAQLQGLAAATPTTMVLDRQGRLAARVSGQVEASTLRGLIDDILSEDM